MATSEPRAWPGGITAITLFTEDLAASRQFYQDVFGLPVHYEDADSVVFRLGGVLVNLLAVSAAPELIAPATVAAPGDGVRFQLTVEVDDVDARCAALARHGVELLNGPLNRPWGPRTASFRDPAGHTWEIAS